MFLQLPSKGVEINDVALSLYGLVRHLLPHIDVVGAQRLLTLCNSLFRALHLRHDDHGRLCAADRSHSLRLATLWPQVVEVLGLYARHEEMSLFAPDVAHEVLGDGNLRLRLLAQRYADGVADTIGKECADSHGTFDASVLALTRLGYTEMEWVVHVLAIHLRYQQAY